MNRERGSFAFLAIDAHCALVLGHDLEDNTQPQTRAHSRILCRKKWIENPCEICLWNAAAGVRHPRRNTIGIQPCGEGEATMTSHGLCGLTNQIHEHLIDLRATHPERRKRRKVLDLLDIPELRIAGDHFECLYQALVQVDLHLLISRSRSGV